jgi:hypothetical protein
MVGTRENRTGFCDRGAIAGAAQSAVFSGKDLKSRSRITSMQSRCLAAAPRFVPERIPDCPGRVPA